MTIIMIIIINIIIIIILNANITTPIKIIDQCPVVKTNVKFANIVIKGFLTRWWCLDACSYWLM